MLLSEPLLHPHPKSIINPIHGINRWNCFHSHTYFFLTYRFHHILPVQQTLLSQLPIQLNKLLSHSPSWHYPLSKNIVLSTSKSPIHLFSFALSHSFCLFCPHSRIMFSSPLQVFKVAPYIYPLHETDGTIESVQEQLCWQPYSNNFSVYSDQSSTPK